jgi:uncharacterized repeat protein (TIGR01451 family)
MHRKLMLLWGLLALLLLGIQPVALASDSLIDDFGDMDSPGIQRFAPNDGFGEPNRAVGAAISLTADHAGTRTLQAWANAGSGRISAFVNGTEYDYSSGPAVEGIGRIDYDFSPAANLRSRGEDQLRLTLAKNEDTAMEVFMTVTDTLGRNSTASKVAVGTDSSQALRWAYGEFSGVDFTQVAAIRIQFAAPVDQDLLMTDLAAEDQVLPSIQVIKQANPTGCPGVKAGDSITYTIVVSNDGPGEATGIVLTDTLNGSTPLTVGSVTTTKGTITKGNSDGDTSVAIDIGSIVSKGSVTVTFAVTVNAGTNDLINDVVIRGDAGINKTSRATTLRADACLAAVEVTKAVVFTDDNCPGPKSGETLNYTLQVKNTGTGTASAVILTDTLDPNTTLTVGSVTTSQGTVTTGNTSNDKNVSVNIGNIAQNKTVSVGFAVTVGKGIPEGTEIKNTASVLGTNVTDVSNRVITPTEVSCTVPQEEVPTLGQWGALILALSLIGLATLRMRGKYS